MSVDACQWSIHIQKVYQTSTNSIIQFSAMIENNKLETLWDHNACGLQFWWKSFLCYLLVFCCFCFIWLIKRSLNQSDWILLSSQWKLPQSHELCLQTSFLISLSVAQWKDSDLFCWQWIGHFRPLGGKMIILSCRDLLAIFLRLLFGFSKLYRLHCPSLYYS